MRRFVFLFGVVCVALLYFGSHASRKIIAETTIGISLLLNFVALAICIKMLPKHLRGEETNTTGPKKEV